MVCILDYRMNTKAFYHSILATDRGKENYQYISHIYLGLSVIESHNDIMRFELLDLVKITLRII